MNEARKRELIETGLALGDHLFRRLFPEIPEELLTLDVTMPQMKIMLILFISGPRRMSTLAADLNVTLPTATSLIDRLVDKGFVTRENQSDDRRVVLCRLAEDGQKALNRVWETARYHSQQLLEGMSPEKLQMFIEVLKDMLKTTRSQMASERMPDPVQNQT